MSAITNGQSMATVRATLNAEMAKVASLLELVDIVESKASAEDVEASLEGKSDVGHGHSQSEITGLGTALSAKADLVAGVIPTSQIPAIAITEFVGYATSAAGMTGLVGQKGDWCIRQDLGTVFVITGDTPNQPSSWTELSYPTAPVSSVNGSTGAVNITKTSLSLGNVDNTADASKPVSTAQQTAINGRALSTITILGTGLASGGGSLASNRTIDVLVASQVEAEAGTATNRAMTPQRTAQAIDKATFSKLVRVSGVINGYLDPGSVGTPSSGAYLEFSVAGWSSGQEGSFILNVDGTDYPFNVSFENPNDGSFWISSDTPDSNELATSIVTHIGANISAVLSPYNVGQTVYLGTTSTNGSGSTLRISSGLPGMTNTDTTQTGYDGWPDVPPSGHVPSCTLKTSAGKKLRLVRAFVDTTAYASLGFTLAWWSSSGGYTPILAEIVADKGCYELVPKSIDEITQFLYEPPVGADLVLYFPDGNIPNRADPITVGAIVEVVSA